MTSPRVLRIFFAIDLLPEIKQKLARYISQLKKKAKPNTIRWTKPENLHITLQFLAEVKAEHIDRLLSNVKNQLQESLVKKSAFKLGNLHLFPNPYRPRVIVLDITPQDDLVTLSGTIGVGIQATEYEVEKRPFRAHLTLGRIKYSHGVDLSFLSEQSSPEISEINVDEVILYRSEPQDTGSKYTLIDKIGLRA